MFDILQYWMVFNDPPDHTRLRGLVNRAFTPKAIAAPAATDRGGGRRAARGVRGRGRADLIRDFAFPIPAVVIAEMLGVPAADRDLFKSWSDAIMVLVFGAADAPGRREQAQRSLLDLAGYLHDLVAHFRRRAGART